MVRRICVRGPRLSGSSEWQARMSHYGRKRRMKPQASSVANDSATC